MENLTNLTFFGERQQALLRLLLVERDGLTVDELAERLEITRTAVNQHLRSLVQSDYIAKGRARESRGRPSHSYLITSRGMDLFTKQYVWFSSLVLEKIRLDGGGEKLRLIFREMAKTVAESHLEPLQDKPSEERIEALGKLMLELGYEAEVVKGEGGQLPVIKAHNCVYHHLASEYPEVCDFDLQLLEDLSGGTVHHEECMVRGGSCCRFRFEKKE
ncbi:MAG TPA: MarR family transcriptional regulator [Chthoniobacteraceae bacterium]|nr:MarR family transcriptional regulator [Chthoniobacteraceae bacterium]